MDASRGEPNRSTLRQARKRMGDLGRLYVDHVFVSFSGEADRLLARRLRRCLRGVASPWLGRHRLRVFMDEPSLAPGGELGTQLLERVTGSARLVLIASPESAQAPWVDLEVGRWQDRRGDTPVILAHSAGGLVWPHGAADFDWALTDALNRSRFEGVYRGVPLWVDLTTARDRRFGGRKALRLGAAKIAASLLGVDPDALWRTEQRRRRSRSAIAMLGVCAVLTAASLALVAQQDSARQRAVAAATQVLTAADRLRGSDSALAAQLDIASYQLHPTALARTDLMNDESTPLASALPAPAVAFSPDGRLIAGFDGHAVPLWDATSLRQVGSLPLPAGAVAATVAFSPDSTLAAVGGAPEGGLSLFRVSDPAHPVSLGRLPTTDTSAVTALAFSPDGTELASGQRSGAVRLWHAPAITPSLASFALDGGAYATGLAFSADGAALRTANSDASVDLWPASAASGAAGTVLVSGSQGAVALSGDGTAVTASLEQGNTFLWTEPGSGPGGSGDAAQPRLSATHVDLGAVDRLAFGPGGLVLATTDPSTGTLTLWNMGYAKDPIPLGPPLASPFNPKGFNASPLFNADGTALAWGSALWHLPVGYLVDGGRGLADSSPLGAPYASVDGNLLVVAGEALPVQLIDLTSPPRRRTLPTSAGVSASVSPGGRFVLVNDLGSIDRIRLWRVSPDFDVTEIAVGGALDRTLGVTEVRQSAVSADGRYLALVTDSGIEIWDVSDPGHPRRLAAPTALSTPKLVSFGTVSDGLTVLGSNGDVHLWEPAGGGFAPGMDLTDPRLSGASLAVGGQGSVLAVANDDGGATVWSQLQRGRRAVQQAVRSSGLTHVAVSADGGTLATGSSDGTVQLWDLRADGVPEIGHPLLSSATTTDRFIIRRTAVTGVAAVAFDSDGSVLAAANADGTVRVWDTDPARAIARICAATVDAVSSDAWAQNAPGIPYRQVCPNQTSAWSTPGSRPPTTSGLTGSPGTSGSGAPAAAGQCSVGALRMRFSTAPEPVPTNQPQGRTTLVVTNTSRSSCTLYGLPVVVLHGPDVPGLGPAYQLRIYTGGKPPAVGLSPGAQAHVDVTWSADSATPGWTPANLTLVLPAGAGTLQLPWPSGVSVFRQDAASRPATFVSTYLPGPS